MTESLPLSQIREVTERSYHHHHAENTYYKTGRGVDAYVRYLPKLGGGTYVDVIEQMISQGRTPRVLDVGCGQGVMLGQLKERYENQIEVTGLTAFDSRKKEALPGLDNNEYVVGDAHDMRSLFANRKFDVIVSIYALMYIADPLRVVKGAYHLLDEGGKAYFDAVWALDSENNAEDFEKYWEGQGVHAEVTFGNTAYPGLAFEKGSRRNLPMPVTYSRIREWGVDYKSTLQP